MQKRYGTTEQEIEYIVEGWAIRLNEYPIRHILDAAWKYTESRSDIPTPANIINIIKFNHPEGKQKLSMLDSMPTQREI